MQNSNHNLINYQLLTLLEIRAYTIFGFIYKQSVGPKPNLSITPGLNASIKISAEETNFLNYSTSYFSFRSRVIDYFPL
jgi:hypothetical protein